MLRITLGLHGTVCPDHSELSGTAELLSVLHRFDLRSAAPLGVAAFCTGSLALHQANAGRCRARWSGLCFRRSTRQRPPSEFNYYSQQVAVYYNRTR